MRAARRTWKVSGLVAARTRTTATATTTMTATIATASIMDFSQLSSGRKHVEVRLRFRDGARVGWARHQAIEVGRDVLVGVAERNDLVGIEQCGGGRAISHGEIVAHGPCLRSHLL